MKKDWDRNEWQGRSRKQVETNHSIAVLVVGLLTTFLLALIIKILVTL